MEAMERDLPYEVSEIKECGLTEVGSRLIRPPQIEEAFGWLECMIVERFDVSDGTLWIVREVLEAEARDEAVEDVVAVETVKPLNHITGDAFVTEMKIIRFKRAC